MSTVLMLALACSTERQEYAPTPPATSENEVDTGFWEPAPAPMLPIEYDFGDPEPVTAPLDSAAGHAQQCAQVLGPIPSFNCLFDGEAIDIRQDGSSVEGDVGQGNCDNPGLIDAGCDPFARVGRFTGTHPDGTERPEVDFVFLCRSGPEPDVYMLVAMIGHNATTGATCYFQAEPVEGEFRPDYPTPMDPANAEVWQRPDVVAAGDCHVCHDADPWIHSAWIDSVSDPRDPTKPIVPEVTGPDSPYHVVGPAFDSWQLATPRPDGNSCVACHRAECQYGELAATGSDAWMPPGAPGSRSDDAEQIADCCGRPWAPGCNTTRIPVGLRYTGD